ncbi:MAG: geranylgeranylglycerol-phosphate geranylgeranyltransferase [Bacteroidales bacterium]|jgi:4-hydroxybenzoate polyprenyltransferase|nr:geranylgeranylglycerol-phosphate geranylgeranyltransferase [Bacteroidales bacterium]
MENTPTSTSPSTSPLVGGKWGAFLNLIRYKNLAIIVLTMLVVRYGIVLPMAAHTLPASHLIVELQFPLLAFILLVAATVCISAAGYIINDYFDISADMLNRPEKVIVGKTISRRKAILLHWIFNIVGVACGTIASIAIGHLYFSLIFVFIAGLLWFYSTTFSKEPFLGNVVIALLVALVPLIAAVYELLPLNFMYQRILIGRFQSFEPILLWCFGFSVFAFLYTLIREIVKDIEDLEGDAAYGRNTIPIAFGIKITKIIVLGMFIIAVFALIVVQFLYVAEAFSYLYISLVLTLPTIISAWLFHKAQSAREYHIVSTSLKLILIAGLLFVVLRNFFV